MLSMKTLRVAIVTIGSALMLGPGFAAATVQHLDGTVAGGNAPMAAEYAYELLTAAPGQSLTTPVGIMSPNSDADGTGEHTAHKLVVSPRRVLESDEDSLYIRLSFGGGMVFDKLATDLGWRAGVRPGGPLTCMYDSNTTDTVPDGGTDPTATTVTYPPVLTSVGLPIASSHSSGGSKGDSYVVYRLDLADPAAGQDFDGDGAGETDIPTSVAYDASDPNGDGADDTDVDDADTADVDEDAINMSESCDVSGSMNIWVDVVDYLAIPADKGSYTAMISLHSDPDQAQAGTNASSAVRGSATIVRAVAGLNVEVEAEDNPAVAHVGTAPEPFLWFRDRSAATGLSNSAVLGSATATIGRMDLFNPTDGDLAVGSDLIPDDSLTFTIEGDLSIGAFNMAADRADACLAAGKATDEMPVMGNVPSADDAETGAKAGVLAGQDSGTYHLCVQVDVHGPNTTPIPAGSYDGTITQGTGATAKDLTSGIIGQIRRNGTTVKLTYLTVSEKYNQRIIIVNDGANEARYDIGAFVTEDGTTATPQSMASGMVPGGGQVVIPVADVVSFSSADGRRHRHRAAATLSMNADVGDVQVATTQVNLDNGSTDTVVYAAVDGAVVQ